MAYWDSPDYDRCSDAYDKLEELESDQGYHNIDGTFTCTCGEDNLNMCFCITLSINEEFKQDYYYQPPRNIYGSIDSDVVDREEKDQAKDNKAVREYLSIKDITKDADNRILQPIVGKEAQEYFMKKHADIIEKHGDIDGLGVIHRGFYIPFIGENQKCVPLKIQLIKQLRRGPVICKVIIKDSLPIYSFTYL